MSLLAQRKCVVHLAVVAANVLERKVCCVGIDARVPVVCVVDRNVDLWLGLWQNEAKRRKEGCWS